MQVVGISCNSVMVIINWHVPVFLGSSSCPDVSHGTLVSVSCYTVWNFQVACAPFVLVQFVPAIYIGLFTLFLYVCIVNDYL